MSRSPDLAFLQSRGFTAFGFLLAYLIFSPLLVELGFPASNAAISLMDWQRILELLTVACTIFILAPCMLVTRGLSFSLPSVPFYGWVTFFVLGACSSALSAIPAVAWLEWVWILCWFLATVLMVLSAPERDDLRNVAITFVMGVMASYSVLFYVTNSEALYSFDPILSLVFPGFNNLRVFSDYQTAILPFIPLAIARVAVHRFWRFMAWCLAATYAALAFASGSRSLFFGQLVALLMLAYVTRGMRTGFFIGQLRMWCFGLVAYALLFLIIPLFINGRWVTNVLMRGTLSYREVLWRQAWGMMLESPIFGVGPMHFAVIPNEIAASPHNQVLQLLAEWGLPAALVFVTLSVIFLTERLLFLRRGTHDMQPFERHFSIATAQALVALLAQSFVSPVFNNPASQMLLTMLVVLSICSAPAFDALTLSASQSRIHSLSLVAVFALLMLGSYAIPSGFRIEDRTACYIEHQTKIIYFKPRFWQQGEIFQPCENLR